MSPTSIFTEAHLVKQTRNELLQVLNDNMILQELWKVACDTRTDDTFFPEKDRQKH